MITYPLIQFGTVFLTNDNLSTGIRYIAFVDGLDDIALTDNIQIIKALDGTVFSQFQPVKDTLITVRVPRMDFAKFDAIRDVINAAIAGSTTFNLNITANGEAFTFTAKPGGITYEPTIIANMIENVAFSQYCTD